MFFSRLLACKVLSENTLASQCHPAVNSRDPTDRRGDGAQRLEATVSE
jgi:hypothetical protein